MARKARKSPPIPEVLNRLSGGRKWTVMEPDPNPAVQNGADMRSGQMRVPLDDSDASAFMRTHEMARLTWSPDAPITDPYEQAFEEARLNLLTKQVGLPTDTYREPGVVETTIANNMANKAAAALTRVALTGTSDEAVASRTLAGVDPRVGLWANEALTVLRKSKLTFKGVQEAAEYLRSRVVTSTRKPVKPHPDGKEGEAKAGIAREGAGASGDKPMPAPKLVLPPTPKPPKAEAPKKPDDSKKPVEGKSREAARRQEAKEAEASVPVLQLMKDEGNPPTIWAPPVSAGARWGTMTVEVPPMPLRLPRRVGKGKWRPADSGAVPRRMERWCSDQAVFSTKGRQRSGTVLVDGSGSMGLSHAQILQVVLKAPAASVAVYSGGRYMLDGREIGTEEWTRLCTTNPAVAGRVTSNLDGGKLQLLARKGRRVKAIPSRAGANVVDGPALRWLARQRAPRVWVSDMQVTGVGENTSEALSKNARDICRMFGIKVVPTVEAAIRLLGGAKQLIRKS